MKQIYRNHINDLVNGDRVILKDWNNGKLLFKPIFNPKSSQGAYSINCGCLLEIRRSNILCAINENGDKDIYLTKNIRKDYRIPSDHRNIKLEDLELFGNWQSSIDDYYKTGKLKVPV